MTKRALAALLTSGVIVALVGGPAVSLAQSSDASSAPLTGELLIWDTGILGTPAPWR